MELTGPFAERYVVAVDYETERNRLYAALLTAQLAGDQAAVVAAQRAVDEFEGEGDY